jgi:hypothetical protein
LPSIAPDERNHPRLAEVHPLATQAIRGDETAASVSSDYAGFGSTIGVRLRSMIRDAWEICRLPQVEIDLMCRAAANNDPFYERLVRDFYATTRRRHRRFPLFRQNSLGLALAHLPATFDEYFMAIEASARRNVKKARRLGYHFGPIEFNDHMADIGEIRRSAETRQGAMPDEFLTGEVPRCSDPPPKDDTHGWPYFGVLKGNKLVAYAGCFVCGQVCVLEHIYGHIAYQSNGVVPLLIVGIAQHLIEHRPPVQYFCYDTYFGASINMRRFKRKFLFRPHKVKWVLG